MKDVLQVLVERRALTPESAEQLREEAVASGRRPEELVEERKLVSAPTLALARSIAYDLAITDASQVSLPGEGIRLFPPDFLRRYRLLPLAVKDSEVTFGVVDPGAVLGNADFAGELARLGLTPRFTVISSADFQAKLGDLSGGEAPPILNFPRGADVPIEILARLPPTVAAKYRFLITDYAPPLHVDLAALEPDDPRILETARFIEKRTNLRTRVLKIGQADFDRLLEKLQKEQLPGKVTVERILSPEELGEVVEEEEGIERLLGRDLHSVAELEEIIRSEHIPRTVAGMLNLAISQRATDIHLEPTEKDDLLRYRIDGLLREVTRIPKDLHPALVSRIKILARLKIDETRIPQDGRFDANFRGREVDVRVATFPTIFGEKVVLRLLDKSKGVLTLEELGLAGPSFDALRGEIAKPHGVILATGPTGAGKSTTLYAIILQLRKPEINIVTLEDPVEYQIEGVNQAQVKPQIGFDFASGLRSILRQDPNIIMAGEIRDLETAQMVTHAALTGHLVLSTLHTNDAAGAIPRLINMGIEPFLITSAMNAIIAQRLVRTICADCKEEVKLSAAAREEIEEKLASVKKEVLEQALADLRIRRPFRFFHGRGCKACDKKGFRGRIGIFEVLVISPEIEDLAIRRRPASEIATAALSSGMIPMEIDGILKILQGVTTYDEVLRVTVAE